jgi:hypothetical protein
MLCNRCRGNGKVKIYEDLSPDTHYSILVEKCYKCDGTGIVDWINEKDKKIIEFFGDWWHGEEHRANRNKDFTSNEIHEESRINFYKVKNYDCLIIWENELKNIEKLKIKILKFQQGE